MCERMTESCPEVVLGSPVLGRASAQWLLGSTYLQSHTELSVYAVIFFISTVITYVCGVGLNQSRGIIRSSLSRIMF